jgi:hypothetical protein
MGAEQWGLPFQVDFYGFPGWSPKSYVKLWDTIVDKMGSVIKLGGPNEPKLQGPAIAGFAPGEWNAAALINAGMHEGKAGKLLGTFGEHHYSVSSVWRAPAIHCPGRPPLIPLHPTITGRTRVSHI